MTTALMIVGVIIVLAGVIYFVSETDWAQRILDWWWTDVHTIWWGRIIAAVGGVMLILLDVIKAVDLSTILTPKAVTYATIIIGVATEMIRRYKADDV